MIWKILWSQNGRAQGSAHDKMVYSYFTLKYLEGCIKRYNLTFPRVLVYIKIWNYRLMENVEEKLKRWQWKIKLKKSSACFLALRECRIVYMDKSSGILSKYAGREMWERLNIF